MGTLRACLEIFTTCLIFEILFTVCRMELARADRVSKSLSGHIVVQHAIFSSLNHATWSHLMQNAVRMTTSVDREANSSIECLDVSSLPFEPEKHIDRVAFQRLLVLLARKRNEQPVCQLVPATASPNGWLALQPVSIPAVPLMPDVVLQVQLALLGQAEADALDLALLNLHESVQVNSKALPTETSAGTGAALDRSSSGRRVHHFTTAFVQRLAEAAKRDYMAHPSWCLTEKLGPELLQLF